MLPMMKRKVFISRKERLNNMDKREAKVTTEIIKWLKVNMRENYLGEVKITKTNTFCYSTWIKKQPHQLRNLQICGRHFIYKFSDIAALGTPVDIVSLANCPGYFFIQFYKPRVKTFYVIESTQIQKEIDSGVKSLTEKRAGEIAYKIGNLC